MTVFPLMIGFTLLSTFLLTPVFRKLAFLLNFLDSPNSRKIHLKPTPLLGGLALYGAVILTVAVFFDDVVGPNREAWRQVMGILGGSTVLVVAGILDDRGLLHSQVKLIIAMPVAAGVLVLGGVRIDVWPGAELLVEHQGLSLLVPILLTIFSVLAVTAAFSIFDYMDGLSSGVSCVAACFFLYFALENGQVLVAALAATMVGACLGFLYWNFNPARIFLGDSGALFIGFMMATLAIKLRFPETTSGSSWLIPWLVLGTPIFDASLVTVSRLRKGLNPFSSPGRDHTAHRLTQLGLTQRAAVITMYLSGSILGCFAIGVHHFSLENSYLLGGLLLIGVIVLIVILESTASWEDRRQTNP